VSDETQTTYYGYERPGDPDYDSASAAGIGDRDNQLSADPSHHSVALTQAERIARFGVSGKSTGQPFEYNGAVYYDEDSAPESNRRVDIYSPSGPQEGTHADEYQHVANMAMSDEQIREKYLAFLPNYYEKQAPEEEKPEEPKQSPTGDLFTKLKNDHPELSKESDQDIFNKVIRPAFPEISADKLEVYARDPNAAKLIKEEEERPRTPLEKFKIAYPDIAKGKSDDDLSRWLYDNQGAKGDYDQFKERLNPPKPSTNAVGLAAFAQNVQAAEEHTFADIDRAPQSLADLWKAAGIYGWEQSATDWARKNVPGYAGADDYFRSFTKSAKERADQFDQQANQRQEATGSDLGSQVAGVAGQAVGSVPGVAISFGMGSTGKAAALWGMAWEGTTGYGRAVEEHQKNAVGSSVQEMGMRGFSQLLMNTGWGRVASGFANSVASAADSEVENWIQGRPSSINQDAKSWIVGLVTGVLMSHGKGGEYKSPLSEKGEIQDDMHIGETGPPAPKSYPVSASSVLGQESEVESPVNPIATSAERPVNPSLSGVDWLKDLGSPRRSVTFNEDAQGGEFTFHDNPAVNEEVTKAVDHHEKGNVDEAHDHLDRAIALMTPEEQKDFSKKVIDKIEDLGTTKEQRTPAENKKSNESSDDPFNDYFFSGVPINPDDLDAMLGEAPKLAKFARDKEEGVNFYAGLPHISLGETPKELKYDAKAKFSPETYAGDESETAGAIVKAEKGRTAGMRNMAQAEIARQAGIEAKLKGGIESHNRENYFNKFSSDERVQHFVDYQEGRTLSDPKADWIYKNVYGPMYEAIAKRDESYHIVYDERENYFFQLLSHPRDALPRLLNDVRKSVGGQSFVKPRQMMLALRLALGHKMLTDNPERLMQMRWAASDRAIEKIRTLREFEQQGLAYRSDDPNLPYDVKSEWSEFPTAESAFDPKTGEPSHKINYRVSPGVVPVLNNAFDQRSYMQMGAMTRTYFKVVNGLKGLGSIKLQWSLFHPLHIAQIAGADIATEAQRRTGLGVANKGDVANAFTAQIPPMGIWHVARGFMGMADEVNVLKGRIPWSQATATVKENVKMFMDMGLKVDVSEETQMMFHKFITDQIPKAIRDMWRNDHTLSNLARMGYRTLSGEWFSHWWFGELTPRIKMASAVMRRDTLYKTNPDLFKPQNRAALLKEYQKINRDIEGRYGEMNYDTLLWPRMAKELGTSHLLALGWQIGLVRTTGDAVMDMTKNVAHMARMSKEKGPGWSNRLAFGLNYNASQLMTGAAITWMATRTVPTLWDMVFPRVDPNDPKKRVQMQGFMKEFPATNEYINQNGGWPTGIAGGLTHWAGNKLNPSISTTLQAAYNKDYMGKPIGNALDILQYWVKGVALPISGANILDTVKKEGKISIGDAIMDGLGFTPSGRWTSDSGTDNSIVNEWSGSKGGTKEVHDAREAYRRAFNSGVQKDIDEARSNLVRLKLTERQIHNIETTAHLSTGQKVFNQLSHDRQRQRLKEMSPEERKEYLQYASPEVRNEFGNQ
jgi:hypothetical protein